MANIGPITVPVNVTFTAVSPEFYECERCGRWCVSEPVTIIVRKWDRISEQWFGRPQKVCAYCQKSALG